MSKSRLSRRRFNAGCVALGMSMLAAKANAQGAGSATGSKTATRTVKLPDGTLAPALGQGSWHLGQGKHPAAVEEEAIRTGISLGMTLIDTSGNYGNGQSEQFIGKAIAGQRNRIFLVTKVEAEEIAGDGIARACAASLSRLGTDYVDLYLLHFPVPTAKFSHVVSEFEKLRAAGKIRAWGVSNFNRGQMEELFRLPNGNRCATNQVQYSLTNRRIERDLLPWCKDHNLPVMAYSPLGSGRGSLTSDRVLAQIGDAHGCSAAAVALAWTMRSGSIMSIPESGTPAHTKENAQALSLTLTPQDLQRLDAAYPQ